MSPQIISLIELAANVTLAAIPVTAAWAPLAAAIEAGINPLISSIQAGATKTTDIMAGYGALLGVIGVLKQQTGLAPEVLAKLNEYALAAEQGTAKAISAGTVGYDPSQLSPVQPIS